MTKLLAIFAIALIGTESAPGHNGCAWRPQQHLTPAQKLQHFRQHYVFVERGRREPAISKPSPPHTNGRINLVSGSIQGSSNCPWTWVVDEDVNRSPRYLVKAQCPSCNPHCRAVFYTHSSLMQRCDRTTGEIIWKRVQKTLEIAYVYDP